MFMTRFMADYRIEISLFLNIILEFHLIFELRNSIIWGFEEIILEEFVLKFPANFSRHLANICLIHFIKQKEITLLSIFHNPNSETGELCAQGHLLEH